MIRYMRARITAVLGAEAVRALVDAKASGFAANYGDLHTNPGSRGRATCLTSRNVCALDRTRCAVLVPLSSARGFVAREKLRELARVSSAAAARACLLRAATVAGRFSTGRTTASHTWSGP